MTTSAPTLTDDHQRAWARTVRVSNQILQSVEAALKAQGLPPLAWYDLLWELVQAGDGGARPVALQSAMLIPQYNLSRLIERVVTAGYAERVACEGDGRGYLVRITDAGQAIRRRMWPVYRGILEADLASRIDAGEARQLADILGRFSDINAKTD